MTTYFYLPLIKFIFALNVGRLINSKRESCLCLFSSVSNIDGPTGLLEGYGGLRYNMSIHMYVFYYNGPHTVGLLTVDAPDKSHTTRSKIERGG